MAVLKGTAGVNRLLGGALADTIYGFGGNDTLLGNGGKDTLLGGIGNDALFGGAGNDTLRGGSGNDILKGEGGNDILKGEAGADKMYGGAGNDKYYVDSKNDRVNEGTARDKADTIYTTVSINIATAAFGAGQIEQVIVQGTKAVNVTGDSKNDTLVGNSAANILRGGLGDDRLLGGGGADILVAGGGKDRLDGGTGNDLLIAIDGSVASAAGGTGTDTLKFTGSNLSIDFGIASSLSPTGRSTIAAVSDSVSASGLEIIDIRGAGANQLNFDLKTLDAVAEGTKLQILSDPDDTVTLGFNLTPAGTLTEGGITFDVFTSGTTVLLIPQASADVLLDGPVLGADILDGVIGFRLNGAGSGDIAGFSVSGAGDINGDGFYDFLVGAPDSFADGQANGNGTAYLIYGTAAGFPASFDLSALDGVNGFRIDGLALEDAVGAAVAAAGDINGDGFDDIIIGADYYGSYTTASYSFDTGHAAYVVFGKSGGFGSAVDLSALDGTDGFRIDSSGVQDNTGRAVAGLGDINGDGFDDLIVGATYHDAGGAPTDNLGGAFVILGAPSFADTIDVATLNGSDGFLLEGVGIYDYAGYAVSSAGDVDGDGFQDILVSARLADTNAVNSGATYLVFGKAPDFAPVVDLATLDGTIGYRFDGLALTDNAGVDAANAGDVNGDGFDDLIIGAWRVDTAGTNAGAAYVVFGGASNLAGLDAKDGSADGTIDLSELDGTSGFRLVGVATEDNAGRAVASAGDINGDGYDDLIVGAPDTDQNGAYSGSAYIVFGGPGGFAASIDLSTLDGQAGFRIDGQFADDSLGWTASSAGDIDGDGFDDIVLGAAFGDADGTNSGGAYIVFGNDFRLEATQVASIIDKNPDGTAGADILIGDVDVNIITGNGGADAISGGAGNDEIHVSDGTFFRIDGGSGTDVLHLDYKGAIDFGNIDANALTSDRGRISGIEAIDVANGEANDLTLHLADILDIDCQANDVGMVAGLDNVLRLDGGTSEGDTLTLDGTNEGWALASSQPLTGYEIYETGNIKIAVDVDIGVTVT